MTRSRTSEFVQTEVINEAVRYHRRIVDAQSEGYLSPAD